MKSDNWSNFNTIFFFKMSNKFTFRKSVNNLFYDNTNIDYNNNFVRKDGIYTMETVRFEK